MNPWFCVRLEWSTWGGERSGEDVRESVWWLSRCVHFVKIIKLHICDSSFSVWMCHPSVKRDRSRLTHRRKDWDAWCLSLSKYRALFKIRKETSSVYPGKRKVKQVLIKVIVRPGRQKDFLRIRMIQIRQWFVGRWEASVLEFSRRKQIVSQD